MEQPTNPQGEVSIGERLSAALAASAGNQAQESEAETVSDAPQESQAFEESEAVEASDAAPETEQEEPTEEITWNGETKRMTRAELRELAQQGFDYTQKTQSLAEQRKAFEAQVQQAKESYALQSQQLEAIAEIKALDTKLQQFDGVNWLELAESDPVQYLKLKEAHNGLKEARNAKIGEAQQRAQALQQQQAQTFEQHLAKEAEALANALPEFRGEKAVESKKAVAQYLEKSGWTAQEIGSLADHRAVTLAYKAMQFDRLQTQKAETLKSAKPLPPVVKPGASNSKAMQQASKYSEQRAQLRETDKPPAGLLSKFI